MGPINWIGVIVAANLAVLIGVLWYGVLFRRADHPMGQQGNVAARYFIGLVLMLLPATMFGHNFARTGAQVLAVKPWLYWMMSGGLALAFVCPALLLSLGRYEVSLRQRVVDCGFWLVAFLAMGTVFWALG